MKRNPYYTWLRKRTATHHFAERAAIGIRPTNTNAEILDLFTKKRRWLRTIRNRYYDAHMEGSHTLYFQGQGQTKVAETVVMIDIDCQKSLGLGSKEGGHRFAAHLKKEFFPALYFEPSTNGNGMHAYFVLDKKGLPAKTVNAQLRTFEKWLKQEAKRVRADIEDVEIKGTCPVFEWKDNKLVKITAGTNAKLPRGDIRATTHIHITDLTKFVPVEQKKEKVKLVRSCAKGSWCPKAITPRDLADMPRLRRLAMLLGGPKERCSGRVAVIVEDVAIFLLLLRFFTKNMNENGSLPWARFQGLWTALYQAGDVNRAFNPKRFAAIRNHLSSLAVEGEILLDWQDETYSLGRACKWKASGLLMEMSSDIQEGEETSSTETAFTILESYPRPRPAWMAQKAEKERSIRVMNRIQELYEGKQRAAA